MSADIQKATGEGIAQKAMEWTKRQPKILYDLGAKPSHDPNLAKLDCSGFVELVFSALFPEVAPMFRTNAVGLTTSGLFNKVDQPQPGDLIFFPRTEQYKFDHVGIVVSKHAWVGSQTTTGVAIVKMDAWYWSRRPFRFYRYKGSSPLAIQSHFLYVGTMYG